VKSTITSLLADPHWKGLIDSSRIGVAGFSAGGYTSLLIAGAKPRFNRFIGFCDRHPEDQEVCGNAQRFKAEAARSGQTPEQVLDGMQGELARWGDTADPRVKAAFVMAPLSLIFDDHGFDYVHIPLFLYYGQNDHVLLPDDNARHIRPMLKTLVAVKEVPEADHWVFLPPCSDALARDIGPLCIDPPGVDRAKVHAQVNADALAFFRNTLDVRGH
jgi:predicted dienelactone hydrolase